MIVVIEGISAAGKTTYSRRVAAEQCIPEFEPVDPEPSHDASLETHARFWVEHNIRRFQAALAMERAHGFALCDTDPMKSHFDWCRARAGFISMALFDAAVPFIRQAIAERRLGFADHFLVKEIDPKLARAQRDADPTRTRRNFAMHLALQPHLLDWFKTLAEVLPGRVNFGWPAHEDLRAQLKRKAPEADPRRFDLSAFDRLIGKLPG